MASAANFKVTGSVARVLLQHEISSCNITDVNNEVVHQHNSQQAKGRVERNHGTHQDRLVKKMRLKKIQTQLFAYDASNLANLLYSSSQNSSRDTAGLSVKFAVPTIANGKVIIPGRNVITVF